MRAPSPSPVLNTAPRSRWGHAVAAGIVLLAGLGVTVFSAHREQSVVAAADADQFQADARNVSDQTGLHLARYEDLALSFQHAYLASDGLISDAANHRMVEDTIAGNYPGFQGLVVFQGAPATLLADNPALHIEPHHRQTALREVFRGNAAPAAEAMGRAAASGDPVLSAPLAGPTEKDPVHFVFFAPLLAADSRGGAAEATTTSWVGIVVRSDLFFIEALARTGHRVGLEIFDGSPGDGHRIAARPRNFVAADQGQRLTALPTSGRLWTLRMEPLGYDAGRSPASLMILASGAFLSVLCALYLWTLGGSKNRALRLVQTMTHDVRRSEQLFRSLAASSPLGIFHLAPDGRCEYVNDRLCDLTGRSKQELEGGGLTDAYHPADRAALRKAVTRQTERSGALRLRLQLPDGTLRWVKTHAAPLRGDDDRLVGWVGSVEDVTSEVQAQVAGQQLAAELAHKARHDHLTGLANRNYFTEQVDELLADPDRSGVAVLFFDIDRFKVVNDSLGHDAGDTLLIWVGDRLRAAIRDGDVAARFGGDEFVVALPDVTDIDVATAAAERIMTALHHTMSLGNHQLRVTVSLGIALSDPACDADELLTRADTAMYRAKSLGKARYERYEIGAPARVVGSALELEDQLRRAIDGDQLRLMFQPLVSIKTRAIVGVEALVRWEHPQRGLIAPNEFIPLAEESGLVVPLGRWVLHTACAQMKAWESMIGAGDRFSVTVNVSARQLADPTFPSVVAAAVTEHGVDPGGICLEITESALVQDLDVAREALRQLRGIGVRIAVDDFGTGYSSLTHLKLLPIDMLKIDRSFVSDLGVNADNTAIVGAVISLAKALGLTSVAEGVEEADQVHWLESLGCELAQGFYFAKPQLAGSITTMLLSGPEEASEQATSGRVVR